MSHSLTISGPQESLPLKKTSANEANPLILFRLGFCNLAIVVPEVQDPRELKQAAFQQTQKRRGNKFDTKMSMVPYRSRKKCRPGQG